MDYPLAKRSCNLDERIMGRNWFLWSLGLAIAATAMLQSVNGRLQSNRSKQPPIDEVFDGQYKGVKGGVGAAFTEGENWDGLKTRDNTQPPDFKTEGMPAVDKQADSFESRMQKEAKDSSDKSAMRLPTQVQNFHDASSSSLEEEKKWEHMQQSGASSSSTMSIPPPRESAADGKTLGKGDKVLRKN